MEQSRETFALEVNNIVKSYKDFTLSHISFQIPKGYILGYVGPNGAGKTTTIHMISGMTHMEEGEILLYGETYQENQIAYKNKIGYVGDESFFPGMMKITDVRKTLQDFYTDFDGNKFDDFMKKWNLPEKKKIMDFSRGMKVKLMFASVFSRETKLLILDEATNGLDPMFREDILRMLQEYIQDGEKSILFSTHIMDDLERIADYIVLIDNGKMILKDSKENLEEQYILVKGGNQQMDAVKEYLIGIDRQDFGFSALVKANQAVNLPSDFVMEKPSVNQIVTHLLRQQNMQRREL